VTTKNIVWCTHPRHLPKPPKDKTVVLDVAFAAGSQWKSKTKVFLDALGDRLVRYIDHHEHKEGWAHYATDPRFVLVPNKIAHACPELVTPERIAAAGPVDTVVAHADFDGCIAAVKWWRGGVEPWPGADEDARAIDSPGRGHSLTPTGARISYALEEASARMAPKHEAAFLTKNANALIEGGPSDPVLDDEIDTLAAAARAEEVRTRDLAMKKGKVEAPHVFVVRVDEKPDNRVRRNLLVAAEEHAAVGAIFEPDPAGGHWLIAATFDQSLDLEEVEGFAGGRSDYRFARAHADGSELINALSTYVRRMKEGA
jgi:hypothetical protein